MNAPQVDVVWTEGADQSLPLPFYASAGAAGADICANFPPESRTDGLVLASMQRAIIPTGLRLRIPPGFEGQMRSRSGLSLKFGVCLPNSPGTIDADYRGEVGVILVNLGDTPFHVTHGMRVAQLIIAPVVRAGFGVVTSLDDTARGAGGYGSTGLAS
ncbi:MAG: dUTP diphosphatase [Rhodobacteraceae bacterium]|nr:dUTP diphosphatase [Paracoccaceae bacterium]